MRPVPLTVMKSGIDRLRTKGGARADSAYDLVNGYVTEQLTVRSRPGCVREAQLPPGTKGLTAFAGKLHVFASSAVVGLTDPFELHILLHPNDSAATLEEIHFAAPYLGALYVVAEFSDGGIFHYWLQSAAEWEAQVEIRANEFRRPTTPNGYVYRATRLNEAYPAWAPGVLRTVGNGSSIEPSRIEPTEYNEYFYEAVDVEGDAPRSASVEPIWPTATGERIVENSDDTEAATTTSVAPPAPPAPNQPQQTTVNRYTMR